MTRREFRLPDLGEGLAEAEIVQWRVTAGDQLTVNQPLVEVETAKAVVELPSPFAGRLVATHGEPGDTISVGTILVTVDDDETADLDEGAGSPSSGTRRAAGDLGHGPAGAGPAGTARPAGTALPGGTATRGAGAAVPAPAGADGGREPMLVGYGPRAAAAGGVGRGRRRRHAVPVGAGAATPATGGVPGRATAAATHTAPPPGAPHGAGPALAKPPVRRLARDLGVDLDDLVGTGPAGSISRHDVEAAAGVLDHPQPPIAAERLAPPELPPGAPAPGGQPARPIGAIPAAATFDEASRTWRIRVSGVRRATARAMVSSAFTAPHVTEFVSVDLTETLAVRDRIAALPEFAGLRVTPLLFVARALLAAVRRHPMINATWVESGVGDPEIVVSDTVNLGIAVASPRGLLVPNIPGADRLDLTGLATALLDLTTRTRAGAARPADLSGGTITITNIGVYGVDIGTPILNPGEAAILAVGAIRPAPWVHEGQLAVRTVGQLALSFDHRLVDGELGSAVLADVAAMLTDPAVLLAFA